MYKVIVTLWMYSVLYSGFRICLFLSHYLSHYSPPPFWPVKFRIIPCAKCMYPIKTSLKVSMHYIINSKTSLKYHQLKSSSLIFINHKSGMVWDSAYDHHGAKVLLICLEREDKARMRQKKAYEEIKMENLPNLLKDINLNIPKSNKHLIGLNITKPKFKNIIVNFLKTKVKSKSSK